MVVATGQDFVVAEQVLHDRYELHIFGSRLQFENWRRQNTWQKIVARDCARGRLQHCHDHRAEFEYMV